VNAQQRRMPHHRNSGDARLPRDPAPTTTPRRGCTVAGCDRKHFGRGYCRTHHWRWTRTGDPDPDRPIGRYERDTSYWAAHDRLKRTRGLASTHPCADCGAPAREWCYDHHDPDARTNLRGWAYSLNPAHYRPLCRRCKRRNDTAHATPLLDTRQVTQLYQKGHGIKTIAKALQQPYSRIRRTLLTAGITLRPSTHAIHQARHGHKPNTHQPPPQEHTNT